MHNKGYCHRDLKPASFLFDLQIRMYNYQVRFFTGKFTTRSTRKFKIDWLWPLCRTKSKMDTFSYFFSDLSLHQFRKVFIWHIWVRLVVAQLMQRRWANSYQSIWWIMKFFGIFRNWSLEQIIAAMRYEKIRLNFLIESTNLGWYLESWCTPLCTSLWHVTIWRW